MSELEQLRFELSKNILNCKQSQLDEHYMTCSTGTFSRRELAKEIENDTEVGRDMIRKLVKLSLDLVQRGKKSI